MEILGYVELGASFGVTKGEILPFVEKDLESNVTGYLIKNEFGTTFWTYDCKEVEDPKKQPLNEFEKAVYNKCIDLAQTLINKNRDYGDSFKLLYDEYGDYSTEWRLTDKLNRYKTLNKKENLVKDESKEDTLFDMAGYSILTLVTKELNK